MKLGRERGEGLRHSFCGVLVLAVAMVGSSAGLLAGAADWPQWRGPNRDGVVPGATLPDRLPSKLKQVWQVEVGAGYSAPVVAGGKVVVLARQEDNEVVRCLKADTGNELWRDAYSAPYKPQAVAKRHGQGPFATPVIVAGKVYTYGIRGTLSGYDLGAGKLVWRKDFADQFRKPHPSWGAANSPLIEGNLCILGVGTKSDGGLAAFHMDTGKMQWKQFADGAAYSSPVVVMLGGQARLIALMDSNLVGVEPLSGKLLWKTPFVVQYEQNIITPVVGGDLVVISGWRQPTSAYRVEANAAAKVWENDAESMFMSSPVVFGDHLYGLADRGSGTLVCIRLEDGKTLWSSPGGLGGYASIVRAADKLLVLTTKGELLLVAASPARCQELGRARLTDRAVWAHLAMAESRIYVKDSTHLTCFELPGK